MPPRSITNADLYQQIGGLSANVMRLLEGEREARDGRQKVLDRIEALDERHARFEERQTNISNRLDAMEPIVASLSAARSKAAGVILAVGIVGSIIGAFIGELKSGIWQFLGFGK